jgi:hypothetical protein
MARYVDYHRPTWWLAWNIETMFRNEAPLENPAVSADVFAARALILQQPAGELAGYLDIPWCKGDEFYLRKLALCCEAFNRSEWK